ncbi:unnamed protein product [Paramecium pentaurelia]|uniref:WD domain, G-beta repeat protein n=1 Tax=Paramecium pentaurelia TaxID=43138 RepID=A0A8S1XRN8_9CILI|nr:unnamed protein product [Paramecium pentaurelia]
MTQYNNFDYTTMFLRQDSQIFCLMNNKILKLDFLDAIEKLKSCLNYYSQKDQRYEYQIKKLEAPNIQFKHCRFSSDLSLCVSIGQGRLFVFQSERNYGGSQYQYKEYFKYLILWNIKTQKYDTLIEPYTTKIGYNRYPILFTDVAVFIPNQNIMVSNKDRTIEFRNCQDFDSITTIATLDNERRIKNLIVSQDGKLLISICEIGIFKLWNISEINQITLQRVIYYEKELVHYRFTNDICCYSLYQRKEEKKYYLESLNLTKYPQETIIALGGGQLVLWNYKSNQNKSIIENNDECFTQIIFGNNSNNLVAARGCVIYLINEITEALNFTSISELKGHQGKIVCLSILYDNQMIVSGSQDKTIRFWSIPQLATVYILLGFIEIISKITLSPNCKDMAVAMEDGSIRLFELQFPENIHDLKLDEINNQSDYTHCYKVFGRQCLISAKNCNLQGAVIEQDESGHQSRQEKRQELNKNYIYQLLYKYLIVQLFMYFKYLFFSLLIWINFGINTDYDCISNRHCSNEMQHILSQEGESQVVLFYCMRNTRISSQLLNVRQFIECLRGKQTEQIQPLIRCADENCL